jgi:hypothetical protein
LTWAVRRAIPAVLLGGLASLFVPGCSSRVETPVADADSTLVYAPKQADGVTATITLCRKVGSKTGKRFGVGRVFTLGEKAKVRALIDLENPFALGERDLMFHLVWLGPNDREFYTKRIDYTPSDSSATLKSTISIPPDRRDPGDYALQVYLFRELIAEKRFRLRAAAETAS